MQRALIHFLLIFCCGFIVPTAPAWAQMSVIVNAKSPVNILTRNEVINLFLGRYRQFFNGDEAEPVDFVDSHPDRVRFYQSLVGKDLSEVNAHWARLLFSGRVRAISKVATTDEVLKWVLTHPGGIGFVDSAKVDARVKVVFEVTR